MVHYSKEDQKSYINTHNKQAAVIDWIRLVIELKFHSENSHNLFFDN